MITEIVRGEVQQPHDSSDRANQSKDLPLEQAAELEDLLSRLARRMFVLVPDHPTTKMSITQLRICSILQQGPRPVSDLGREIGVTVSNVSQIVERMVRIGLIERYVIPDDLRLRLVKLSPHGFQAMDSRTKYRIECAVAALANIEPSLRPEILRALQSLVEVMVAASPFRGAAGSEPDWVSRLVRETYITTGRSIEDTFDDLFDCLE